MPKNGLMLIALLDIVIIIAGMALPGFIKGWTDPIFVITCAAVAIITYFGFLELQNTSDKGWIPKTGSTRIAITSAILVVYFFVLSFSLFMHRSTDSIYKDLPIMDTLVTNFTTVVGIVIPFYFGASAYVQVQSQKPQEKKVE